MYVACSTLCFGRLSFEDALTVIAELHFSKFDAAIHEHGRHLKPSEVAADINQAAARLRYGPGLTPVAFSLDIDAPDEATYLAQFKAVCRLGRITAVPLVSLKPAALEVPLEHEVQRLTRLVRLAEAEGVLVSVVTHAGTHTETPDRSVALARQVPGLGLTLDPSHFTAGPHQGKNHDSVYPFVRHVQLRDTGKKPNQFQVRIGQGELEYGRIITQLTRYRYDRVLSVDIRDIPDAPFPMEPEVRKLKYLLESMV